MKKILLIVCLLLPLGLMAETAKETVQRFFGKIEAQQLTSPFTLTVSESATQPLTYNGTLRMHGEQFQLNVFDTQAAYDGQTLYLYTEDINELTLSTPGPEELLEANPLLFAKALLLTSTLRLSANQPKQGYSIDFIPNNQAAGIQKFVLRLSADLLPQEITINEGKKRTTIRFTQPRYERPTGNFVIKQPKAFLNDLR